MKVTLVFVLLFTICVFGQYYSNLVERIVIDDFSFNQTISIILAEDQTVYDPQIIQTDALDAGSGCSGLIGCERDMQLSVTAGLQGRLFGSFVASDQWVIATPSNGMAEFTIQYDGRDNNSTNLDTNGLNNFDLTDDNLANFIQVPAVADLPVTLNFVAYSPNGDFCEADIDIFQGELKCCSAPP